ncbi:MAG TPA: hypothetical protein DCS07_07940 [Bdellovibrionales bacterium]|nr:hypothetical protein [Bdellovibrionales bacterium]
MGESRIIFKTFGWVAGFVVLSALLHFGSPVYSADSGTNVATNEVPVPAMTFGPGADFNVASTLNMGNLINSCMMNPALNNMQAIMKNGTNGLAIGGVCAGSEMKFDRHSLDCSNFEIDGNFDAAKFEQFKAAATESKNALSCQKNALQGLQTELNCLSTQVSALQNQIKTLEASYTQNMGGMAEYVGIMKAVEADRTKQFEDVQGHLRGDERTGHKGLLRMRDELQPMVTAMESEIKAIKDSHKSSEIQRKAFEEDIQRKIMAMTNECFSARKKSNFHCVPNGPAVTAREYVLCRYEQNQRLGAGGVVETSSIRTKQAESKRAELENVLNQILGDSPTESKTPKTAEEAVAQAEQAMNVLNPTDLEAEYGAKLSSFDGKGLGIHGFVMKAMGNCYRDAQKSVNKQRELSSTQLGRNQESIKAFERETKKQVNELLTKYSNKYSEVMGALTGMHLPVNADGCRDSKPASQEICLDDLKKNMRGIWDGSLPQSTVNFMIRGNDAKTTITFQCQGLDGCVTKMQSLAKNLEKDRDRVSAEKKKKIEEFNRKVESRSKQIATGLATQNLRLGDELNRLNGQLTALGVRGAVKTGRVRAEKLEKDEDGLYMAPTSVVGLISNYIGEPGLLDMQDGTFSESLAGISERVKEIGENEAEAAQMVAQLDGRKAKCVNNQMKDVARLLKDQVASLSDCYRNVEFCQEHNGRMQTWEKDVREVFKLSAGSVTSALKSGSDTCSIVKDYPNVAPAEVVACKTALKEYNSGLGKYEDEKQEAQKKYEAALKAAKKKAAKIKATSTSGAEEEEEEEEEEAILPPEDKTSAIENLEREKDTACASTFSALEAMHIKASSLSAAEIGRYADEMTADGLKPGISAASCTAIVEGEFKGTLAEAKALKETGSSGAGRASD